MKHILSILFIALFYSGVAQTSNKKRVLVIPPSRFEFVTEFDLQEIAELNETSGSRVFLEYEKALLNSFEAYDDENFEFVPVDAAGLKSHKRLIKYKYGKFNGKHYNGVDLKLFSGDSFEKLLAQYNTDFVIFITWYDIQKESFARKGKHEKRASYAGHYMDYAIYNLFKQQLAGVAKVKAETSEEPNDLELTFKFLRIKEVQLGYNSFIGNVVEQLSKPIEQ